jgi:hypothetical protein
MQNLASTVNIFWINRVTFGWLFNWSSVVPTKTQNWICVNLPFHFPNNRENGKSDLINIPIPYYEYGNQSTSTLGSWHGRWCYLYLLSRNSINANLLQNFLVIIIDIIALYSQLGLEFMNGVECWLEQKGTKVEWNKKYTKKYPK